MIRLAKATVSVLLIAAAIAGVKGRYGLAVWLVALAFSIAWAVEK